MAQANDVEVPSRETVWQEIRNNSPEVTDFLPIYAGELLEVIAVIRAGLDARPETSEDCGGFLWRWCEAKERFQQAKGL